MTRCSHRSIWLGHAGDAADVEAVLALGVEAIVGLALEESPGKFPRDLIQFRFPLVDGTDNPSWVIRPAVEVIARLMTENVPTLLYCGAGLSRSLAMASMSLAQVEGKDLDSCLLEILKGRPCDVSPGLWADLRSVFETPCA